jgi:hypothetical protein
MSTPNTAPKGEDLSADSLSNEALIEKIASAAVKNMPIQVAAQIEYASGIIAKDKDGGEEGPVDRMMQKLLQYTEEELKNVPKLHDMVVEALLPFKDQRSVLKLMDAASSPETARLLLEVQKSIMAVMSPFIIEAGKRVGERLAQEAERIC